MSICFNTKLTTHLSDLYFNKKFSKICGGTNDVCKILINSIERFFLIAKVIGYSCSKPKR